MDDIDYTEWREKHKKIHTIISDLEEKKRILYEQVRIQKLQAEIERLEHMLEKYKDPKPEPIHQSSRLRGILKAILRPTPAQRIRQKQQLENGIKKMHRGIDTFDKMMDDLSESLRKQTGRGHDDDPVDLIMGKRNRAKVF